jgi:hypothetical protein
MAGSRPETQKPYRPLSGEGHAFWAGNLARLLSYVMLFGMFFLMPFVFERALDEGALLAGLQLMVIPLALGMAPVSGALYDLCVPKT